MNVVGIIPVRYASSRFPGKPLADIAGKTLIERVYGQAVQAQGLKKVFVATDDKRIYDHMQASGASVVMTSTSHASGTDRCCEVLNGLPGGYVDYVVNIQGDEPFILPEQIDTLVGLLDGKVPIATLVKKIDKSCELPNPHVVKVVINPFDEAVYFSRAAIPHLRNTPMEEWPMNHDYFKHIGLYAYRNDVLKTIAKLPPSPLEKAESLEQLRWLENGHVIRVGITTLESFAIDTPEDLDEALARLNVSS